MGKGTPYDPSNPAHRAMKDLIEKKGAKLTDREADELRAELNGDQRMGVIARILNKK